ncbi:MAG: hypothetical protein ABIH82_05615 [Candidatus Woesearchaeota archaeon]
MKKEFKLNKRLPNREKVELSFIWIVAVLVLVVFLGYPAFNSSGNLTGLAVLSNGVGNVLESSVVMWGVLLGVVVLTAVLIGKKL